MIMKNDRVTHSLAVDPLVAIGKVQILSAGHNKASGRGHLVR